MDSNMIILIVLLILVVALFVTSYLKKKQYNSNLSQMREDLKVGDKVMTDSGIVGEVVDSYIEDEYKYFVLKSGKGNNVGFYSVHANAIYYVFGKELNSAKTTKSIEPKSEPVVEQKVEEKKDASKEKSTNPTEKKSSSKKSTQKKTTKK